MSRNLGAFGLLDSVESRNDDSKANASANYGWDKRMPAPMPRELPEQESPGQTFSDCLAAALRFLSYRPRTVHEVRQRLQQRFDNGTAEKTVAYLLEHRYLDDAAFSGQWISSRERRRPRGARALKQELRKMGVEPPTIEDALEGFDESANAYNAGRKPAGRLTAQECSYTDFRRKVSAYLQRRGFAYAVISETVARLWDELGED